MVQNLRGGRTVARACRRIRRRRRAVARAVVRNQRIRWKVTRCLSHLNMALMQRIIELLLNRSKQKEKWGRIRDPSKKSALKNCFQILMQFVATKDLVPLRNWKFLPFIVCCWNEVESHRLKNQIHERSFETFTSSANKTCNEKEKKGFSLLFKWRSLLSTSY